ncbi:hypothetical protein DFH08DRAFT_974267 [Mycena albidolilacea]|uniref:F-box domain-containing protein n=1 Tax=Mycena albidolilacea TaxID=1033008 RepID=A0AAD6Z7D4_9AGAR|nr:hypothetical protein DFH08DRAFT_974267 [Mycena albidolilacea]
MVRARIDEISAEIVLQKTLLKKLEQDRNLVQRQLNAVVDPVSPLPLGDLSLVSRPRPSHPGAPESLPELGAHRVPMLLMNICNTWSAIALATPALWALWAAIRIDLTCASRDSSRFGFAARRTTLIHSPWWRYKLPELARFCRHFESGEQLKHLEICEKELRYAGSDSGEGPGSDADAEIDFFGQFTRVCDGPHILDCLSLPALETLSVQMDEDSGGLLDLGLRYFTFSTDQHHRPNNLF